MSCKLFPGTNKARRVWEWAWSQNFLPGFSHSYFRPFIHFITISTTPNCIAESHFLQKKLAAFGRRETERSCRPQKRWQTALPISQNENPCLLPFVALTDRIDSPASSANYIPAVYCKSNGKITIDIGTLPIFTLASFMMLCPSWIYPWID